MASSRYLLASIAIPLLMVSNRTLAATGEPPHDGAHPADPKVFAQVPPLADPLPLPPDKLAPLPEIPPALEPLPSPNELLDPAPESAPSNQTTPSSESENENEIVIVKEFVVLGSSVFSDAEFQTLLTPFLNRPLTFNELLETQTAITDLYVDAGYVTSGAFIPADQVIENGIVTIQVLEGTLSDITIKGNQRLKQSYVRDRLALAAGPPLNIQELLAALQLLQLNPIIDGISAELIATPVPGENALFVQLEEAQTFSLNVQLNNAESPLLETFQQRVEVKEANLTGQGDAVTITYQHAGVTNVVEARYQRPINPRNGTLDLRYAYTSSEVVDTALSLISPQSETHTWEVGLTQPILETPEDQITLGLHLEQRSSQNFIEPPGLDRQPFGFPGSGSTDRGFTRSTVLQFSQAWQHRTPSQLIVLDSRFRLGTDWFGATGNTDPNEPDINFLAWQGQALWLQRLNPDWLLIARAAGQWADRPLIASELFGLGGANNIRGYRKDEVLADSGFLVSLELQTPIFRWPKQEMELSLAPFADFGVVWNQDNQTLTEESLASIGLGLILQIDDRLTARLDYAIPLIEVNGHGNSLQESGVLFVIDAKLF